MFPRLHCNEDSTPTSAILKFRADNDNMPPQIEYRQMSLAGAAWTVGSLKYLLESGVASLTYYETVGERGFMMGDYCIAMA